MTTLLIIDMQKGTTEGSYHGSLLNSDSLWQKRYRKTVENILKISNKYDDIVFLIHNQGFRNKSRMEIVEPLQKLSTLSRIVYKKQDDGFSAIHDLIKKDVHIVGMNTDACVLKTALSCSCFHNVSVIEKCCYSVYSAHKNKFNESFNEGHNFAIKELRKNKISII